MNALRCLASPSLIIGSSRSTVLLRADCEFYAPFWVTMVLLGETGTGKWAVARELARLYDAVNGGESDRLVRISAAQLIHDRLQNELFGHAKDGYTGATRDQAGIVRPGRKQLLLIDEGHETTDVFRRVLIDLLDGKEMRPVGNAPPFVPDIRIIFATQLPLAVLVKTKVLTRDVAARLNVVTMRLVPLRDRMQDVPALVEHFLARLSLKHSLPPAAISSDALEVMMSYRWPENVREIGSVCEGALLCALMADNAHPVIRPEHLEGLGGRRRPRTRRSSLNKQETERALEATQGNVTDAAADQGVCRKTVQRRIRKHGIDVSRYRKNGDSSSTNHD